MLGLPKAVVTSSKRGGCLLEQLVALLVTHRLASRFNLGLVWKALDFDTLIDKDIKLGSLCFRLVQLLHGRFFQMVFTAVLFSVVIQ